MRKVTVLSTVFTLGLLISLLVGAQTARADYQTNVPFFPEISITAQEIIINSNGTITPSNVPIKKEGNTYTITANLDNSSIIIERGDIVIDGANHTLQGPGEDQNKIAVTLMASNVTVQNMHITRWKAGVYGAYNNNTIANTVFTDNNQGITIYANNYVVSENSISKSDTAILVCSGALEPQGDNNLITRNQIANNNLALDILNSNGTTITQNNITDNTVILTLGTQQANIHLAGFHMLYFNNFINNKKALHIPFGGPFASSAITLSPAGNWDNGTVGNYWSDYSLKYPNATEIGNSGLGDTPYLIEHSTTWSIDYPNGTHLEGTTILGSSTDHYPLIRNLVIPTHNPIAPTSTPSVSPSSSPTPSTTPSTPTPSLLVSPTDSPTSSPTQQPTLSPIPTVYNAQTEDYTPSIIIYSLTALIAALAVIYFKKYKRKK